MGISCLGRCPAALLQLSDTLALLVLLLPHLPLSSSFMSDLVITAKIKLLFPLVLPRGNPK